MAVIDSDKKEINFKIIYYGPGRSGKTTTIQQLQQLIQAKKKSKVTKIPRTEKTIFFDFLALSSDSIGGYKTRFQIYSVPGQDLYDDARKLLLKGVDGIIFVADSQIDKVQENLQSLEELRGHLRKMGYAPADIPLIIQFNKRDLPHVPAMDELRKSINILHVPDFESVATQGKGVLEPFKECLRDILMSVKDL